MQLRLPWFGDRDRRPAPSPPPAMLDRSVLVEGHMVPVAIARHRRARRYVVRVTDDGSVRLTVPRGASIAGGLRFADRQVEWIARERRRRRDQLAPWVDGTAVWFRGDTVPIRFNGRLARISDAEIAVKDSGAGIRTGVEAHLRALATSELTSRCLVLAAQCGHTVSRVSVRNQRSRWGACSARGVITLNWRLVQMPAHVSDYVIFHELMHLRQPNHSRRFWREVESVCPGWREAERWLRKHGREING